MCEKWSLNLNGFYRILNFEILFKSIRSINQLTRYKEKETNHIKALPKLVNISNLWVR